MFRPKQKRYFPAGTFIPTLPRVCAIIQLCMAFTLLLTIILQPYLGDLFAVKSQVLYYEVVLQQDYAEHFSSLPAEERERIESNYETLKSKLHLPLVAKLQRSIELIMNTSPWKLAWLFFSLVLAVFLLLRIEGTVQVIWLLPLLATLYAVDNRFHGITVENSRALLFPTENEIVTHYLDEPLSNNIMEQQRQLTLGWKRYVIEKWAHEVPAEDMSKFERQYAQGNFAFAVAQLPNRTDIDRLFLQTADRQQEPLLLLVLYILWNSFFAFIAIGNPLTHSRKGDPIYGIAPGA